MQHGTTNVIFTTGATATWHCPNSVNFKGTAEWESRFDKCPLLNILAFGFSQVTQIHIYFICPKKMILTWSCRMRTTHRASSIRVIREALKMMTLNQKTLMKKCIMKGEYTYHLKNLQNSKITIYLSIILGLNSMMSLCTTTIIQAL